MDSNKYQRFYPAVYSDGEQEALKLYCTGDYRMLSGRDESTIAVDGYESKLYARIWDKQNKLWFDSDYARIFGYRDTPVRPGFIAPEISLRLPEAMGTPAGSTVEHLTGDVLDHEIDYYRPIYPGDKLTVTNRKDSFYDATSPNGSVIRAIITINSAEVFNQNGELVMKLTYRFPDFRYRSLEGGNEAPNPMGRYSHSAHKYTDQDWVKIKELMTSEFSRGSGILYWEDVYEGQSTTHVCEGPISNSELIRLHCLPLLTAPGLRESLQGTNGEHHNKYKFDPDTGLYTNGDTGMFILHRAPFPPSTARDLAMRLVSNWCGNCGEIRKCSWRQISDVPAEYRINRMPADYWRPSWLLQVPELVEAERFLNTIGRCPDLAYMRGCVTDKYIDQGDHIIELVVWAEDMDRNIWAECLFAVKLPSKQS